MRTFTCVGGALVVMSVGSLHWCQGSCRGFGALSCCIAICLDMEYHLSFFCFALPCAVPSLSECIVHSLIVESMEPMGKCKVLSLYNTDSVIHADTLHDSFTFGSVR